MKKQLFYSITIVLMLLIIVSGGTFAFFSTTGGFNNTITNSANYGILYYGGTQIDGLMEVVGQKEDGFSTSVRIRSSSSNIHTTATIYINIENMTSNLSIKGFKWDVIGTQGGNQVYTKSGTFEGYNDTTNNIVPIVTDYELTTTETVFTVYIWLDGNDSTVGNNVIGGSFSGFIAARSEKFTGKLGTPKVYTVNLYDENATGWNYVWIGQAISSSISKYTTASSAMTSFNHPAALKHKIGNYSGYCMYEKENGVETGWLECFDSQAACESTASDWEADEWTYECRHIEANNAVTESYVVFTITSEMAANNNGMQAGTYELKGGDGGGSFLTNAKIIYDAFGGINCYSDGNEITDSYNANYNPNPSYDFYCSVSGLGASAISDGDVGAGGDGWGCEVREVGSSGCGG